MQWLIDIVKGWVLAQDYLTYSYIDRGDPAVSDYAIGDFTKDGTWHELDLSAIVPENAQAINATIAIRADSVAASFMLRRPGNVNSEAVSRITTQVANGINIADLVYAVDADRKIDYQLTPDFIATWNTIDFTIKGWWL